MANIRDIWLHSQGMIRSARQTINEDLRPLNLSSAEGNILLHLWMHGQAMTQEQLTGQLDISKPAVSRALDSLEGKGFVTRQPDPLDRRQRRLELTGQAREIGPAVEQSYNRLYARALQGITPQELDTFIQLFARMSENFNRTLPQQGMED
mgnify:CR=1 FL=1